MSRRRADSRGKAMQPDVLGALRKASQGLLYPSDTDEPFEAFAWGKAAGDLDAETARRLAGADPVAPVQERTLAEFFANLTDDAAPDADKYKDLQQVVGEQLSGAKVFRFGDVDIDIYVVGKTRDGNWAGLKTKAVET